LRDVFDERVEKVGVFVHAGVDRRRRLFYCCSYRHRKRVKSASERERNGGGMRCFSSDVLQLFFS
jgi:hypothetical protein